MFLLPDDYWTVRQSGKKGRGIFAKKDIPGGVVIGDYLGKVISPLDEPKYDNNESFYSMYYSDSAMIFPDIQSPGIHLLNHSCTPNCWMYTYKGHTLYFSLRHIFPGEEITISYLLCPLDKDCKPCTHLCECGGVICFQTMHLSEKRYEAWNTVHERQEKKTKMEKVQIGQELPALSPYPKSLPDNPIYPLFGSLENAAHQLDDNKLPSTRSLRQLIRQTGKTLQFPALNIHLLGLIDNLIVSKPIS